MLTTTQQQQFQRDGYLVVENVIDPEHLSALRSEYSGLIDALYQEWYSNGLVDKAPDGLSFWQKLDEGYRKPGVDWFQPLDISLPGDQVQEDTPMHFGPAIFSIVTHRHVLDIVESLLGPEITSNPIQHVRIKPPQRELHADEIRPHLTTTAWHQDRGVGHAEADNTDIVTVWLAVTDATTENGCLQVIPKAHGEMLPHCPQQQTAIADGFLDANKAVPLPVKAGGVVLFHPLTPHSSLPNTSDGYRWSFDLRYNVTGQHTGRAHFPDFVARSEENPNAGLRDWREWKKLWEEARVRVAREPHIAIHRWRSDSPFCA